MKYRKLKLGELIVEGDEVFDNHNDGSGWTKTQVAGCIMLNPELVGSYRRPLKSKESVATVKQQAKGCRKAKLPKR